MSMDESATKLVYSPAEVAHMIGTSEWWVREQMRRRRVPPATTPRSPCAARENDRPLNWLMKTPERSLAAATSPGSCFPVTFASSEMPS